jgi:hypothetical protein
MNTFIPSRIEGSREAELPSCVETEIPDALRAVVDRHHRHLAALVDSLRSAGISEALVKHSVDVLIESYRAELSAAALRLAKDSARA